MANHMRNYECIVCKEWFRPIGGQKSFCSMSCADQWAQEVHEKNSAPPGAEMSKTKCPSCNDTGYTEMKEMPNGDARFTMCPCTGITPASLKDLCEAIGDGEMAVELPAQEPT